MIHQANFICTAKGYVLESMSYFVPTGLDVDFMGKQWLFHDDGLEHFPHGIIDWREKNLINEWLAHGACAYVTEVWPERIRKKPSKKTIQ